MQQGLEINVAITDISHSGEGVGRAGGAVVFVPGAVPGEEVKVRITETHKNFARGIPLQIGDPPSPHRQTPECKLSERCGGCSLQHIAYSEQLRLKTELVRQNIARIGGVTDVPVKDIIGMENPWHYRNNVRFKVRRGNSGIELGFFEPESHRLATGPFCAGEGSGPICLLAHQEINRVAARVRSVLESQAGKIDLPAEIAVRRGAAGQVMVVLVGSAGQTGAFARLAQAIQDIQGVASVVANTLDKRKKGAGRYQTLAGNGHITDTIGGFKFKISAAAFFQVNPIQTEVLFNKTLEYCALSGSENVADAYCGVGAITLFLAGSAAGVRGYEVVSPAVTDARANAELNQIKNVRFYVGPVEHVLTEHVAAGYRPEVVVLDPPRSGCRPEVLDAVVQSGARRVVYVSCNPATLARDIKILSGHGFRLAEVQPVDMFPHTSHVESIVLMTHSGLKGK